MSAKLITGILIGASAALVVGYLMTDEESEIRKKIKEKGKSVLDFLCDTIKKGKEVVNEYSEETGQTANAAQERS